MVYFKLHYTIRVEFVDSAPFLVGDIFPAKYSSFKILRKQKLLLIVDRHIRLLSSQGMGLCAKHKGSTE